MRKVADDGSADAGTHFHDDAPAAGRGVFELFLREQEGGVAVLARVAVVIEPGHEDDAVNAHAPFSRQHVPRFAEKGRRRDFWFSGGFGGEELLGFGEWDPEEADEDGEAGGDPEDSFPALGAAADAEVGACGEDVAEGVALLEDAGHQAAGVDGAVFEGHGDGVAVDAAHEEAEEGAHGEELLECGAVDGGDLEEAEDGHVDDHGPFAAEFVTGETEEGGTDGAEEER